MNPIVHRLEIAVWKVVKKHLSLLSEAPRAIVAVSGGPDSVTLLHALKSLIDRHKLDVELNVAHFDHCQRGEESRADCEFVQETAKKLKLPFHLERLGEDFQNSGMSSEEAMRKARYGYLTHLSVQLSAPVVFLGHNFEDNVETVLMHFLRGSNLKGLTGMGEVRRSRIQLQHNTYKLSFVRPLLHTHREEIEEYLSAQGLECREDSSNHENRYRRNWIRNDLLPSIQKNFNAGIIRTVDQFREQSTYIRSYMEPRVRRAYRKCVTHKGEKRIEFDIDMMNTYHPAIALEVISRALKRCRVTGVRDFRHIKALYTLLGSEKTDVESPLPDNYVAVRYTDTLEILEKDVLEEERRKAAEESRKQSKMQMEIPIPGAQEIPGVGTIRTQILPFLDEYMKMFVDQKTVFEEFVDISKISKPLMFRFPKRSDMFHPLGQPKERRLMSFLKDCKIPHNERDRVPLVVDAEKVIWVVKHRVSEQVKFEEGKTKKTLRISFQES